MTTPTTTEAPAPAEVGLYLDEVAAHLASLPWLSEADRVELLDDLNQHLSEVAAEEGTPLVDRLGPPVAYAEELVSAAGLVPPAAPASDLEPGVRARAALTAGWDGLRRAVAEAGDLRPAWWILRGYLAASLLGAVTGGNHDGAGHPGFPIPAVFDSSVLGLLTVAAAVKLSLRLGQQDRPARPWASRVAGAGLAVYGLVLLGNLGASGTNVQWVESGAPIGSSGCLLDGAGQAIENLYPYDGSGRLLDQVLLYDQTGRPLDNLCPREHDDQGRSIATEYGRDQNGAPVINVFPRRQTASSPPVAGNPLPYDVPTTFLGPDADGPTTMDSQPLRPPAVVVPRLVTTTTTTPESTATSSPAAEPTTTTAPVGETPGQ